MPISAMPQPVTRTLDYTTSEETNRLKEILSFYETTRADLLEAIEVHKQSEQDVKHSYEGLSLSLSFEIFLQPLVELGSLSHISELGVMDMVNTEP